MSRRNKTKKNRTPGAGVRQFNQWLRSRAELAADEGYPIDKIRCIRTSSSNIEQWRQSATTSFAAMELLNDPDVIQAQSYGMELVQRDAVGDAKRAELGDAVFELMMCHAPGGVGSRRIGVVLHVGRTLFVYLLTSARADNLQAETDDRRGNAATEILSSVVRQASAIGLQKDTSYRPQVHAREHDRIIRDERHGIALKETFVSYRVIAFIPNKVDLSEPGEASQFSFGTLMSSVAVEGLVRGMNRAEVVMQFNGGYYSSIAQVPFTHGPMKTIEVDDRTGATYVSVNKHRLAVASDVDAARALLRTIVDTLLKDRVDRRGIKKQLPDWAKVAALPQVLSLPSRTGYDLKRGITLGQKPLTARIKSLKSLINRRWIEGWRTGRLTVDVPIKVELKLDLGDDVQIVTKGEKRYYRLKVAMPLPEGGWGVTDDEWDELLRRRYPEKDRTPTTDCHPLAGIGWDDDDDDREYRLATRHRYVVLSRQLSATATERGDRVGWADGPKPRHEATITSHVLHTSVAAAAREALIGLDAPLAAVVLRHAATVRPAERAAFDAATRENLVESLQDALDLEEVATSDRQEARARLKKTERTGDPAAVAEARRKLTVADKALIRAEEKVRTAQQGLDDYDANVPTVLPAPAEELVDVLTATPEFVVAALEQCRGVGPLWLHTACSALFTDWRFRVARSTGSRDRVTWECVMVLDVEDTDDTVLLPLSGEVDSTSNLNGSAAATTVEDWAWRFFYRGESFAEVGAAARIDGSGKKNSWLYKSLCDWLKPAIRDDSLRTAALHCPIPQVRRIMWAMVTGDIAALAGIDTGFIGHIETVYGSPAWLPKWSWCRDTHTDGRRRRRAAGRQRGPAGHARSARPGQDQPGRAAGHRTGERQDHDRRNRAPDAGPGGGLLRQELPPRRADHAPREEADVPAAVPARRLPGPAGRRPGLRLRGAERPRDRAVARRDLPGVHAGAGRRDARRPLPAGLRPPLVRPLRRPQPPVRRPASAGVDVRGPRLRRPRPRPWPCPAGHGCHAASRPALGPQAVDQAGRGASRNTAGWPPSAGAAAVRGPAAGRRPPPGGARRDRRRARQGVTGRRRRELSRGGRRAASGPGVRARCPGPHRRGVPDLAARGERRGGRRGLT